MSLSFLFIITLLLTILFRDETESALTIRDDEAFIIRVCPNVHT